MVKLNYLELKNITFSYKNNNYILKNLNAKFIGGQIIALLGINGSGKTTLFKILTGIYEPENGSIIYNDTIIKQNNIMSFKSKVGFMPEYLSLYKNMTVREVLNLLGNLKGYNNFDLDYILKKVFLLEHSHKKIKALSKGMKQRLNLAQAIIGDPQIILFDEPSNGFDCGSIEMFYTILKNLANNGAIILISSHHLTEIYGNVDKVLILSNGTVIQELDITLTNKNTNILYKELLIFYDDKIDNEMCNIIKNNFENTIINNNIIKTRIKSSEVIKIITFLLKLNIKINDIKINEKILEDILINLS